MRCVLTVLTCLLLGTLSGVSAAPRTLAGLQETNELLQAEYALARSGMAYLLVDLQNRQLHLKSSGLLLESWPIDHYRRWGHPAALPAVNLERKSSPDDPERELQIVNAAGPGTEAAPEPFKALELADMPSTYRLHLVNGTDIAVQPTPAGRFGHLRRTFALPGWYLSRPLISNWNFLRGSPYNELALSLSEQDARELYWAFSEGNPCLIRQPSSGAAAPSPAGTRR